MNWIKENKFLTGFFATMLVGVGVLGYFLYSAMGSYDEATTRYTGLASELSRLQNLPVSPSQKNLTALVAQKKEAVEVIAAFQSSLAAKAIPTEPMTPEQFQDKLKATKNAVVEKTQTVTKLPDKFFLGFDVYETRPPDKDAAAPLGHQLKAIEWLFGQLIESHVTEVKSIKREPLPEEGGKARGTEKGDKKGKAALVNSHPVEISIQCRQSSLAQFLNALVSPKAPQFYIVRTLSVKNQNEKGPPKVVNAAPPPPAPVAVGTPAPPAQPQAASTYIVGEEQIEVTMQIDIVDFAEPAPTSAK